MTTSEVCRFYYKPKMHSCSLLVFWNEDAGKLGRHTVDYLNKKLGSSLFCEIEPDGFFHLGGVMVQDDIAEFPECKFYIHNEKNLIIFQGSSPGAEWYKFLSCLLDITSSVANIRDLYTIGGMVTLATHSARRILMATTNSIEMKSILGNYDISQDLDYETPPGQRPTLSSYLIWIAGRRNIPAAALWVPIPFYLLSSGDPRAQRKTIDFLNNHFSLNIDFADIDEEIHQQNMQIAEVANRYPELDELLHKLDGKVSLTEDENNRIVQLISEHVKKVT